MRLFLRFVDTRVIAVDVENFQDLMTRAKRILRISMAEQNLVFTLDNGTPITDNDSLRRLDDMTIINVSPRMDAGTSNEAKDSIPDANVKKSSTGKKLAFILGGAAVAAVAAPLVVTAGVAALGFGAGGIASGSIAAGMMSSAAIANGGGVVAGGLVATLQSVGAAGLGAAGLAGSAAAGAGVGAAAGAGVGAAVDAFSGGKDGKPKSGSEEGVDDNDDDDDNEDGDSGGTMDMCKDSGKPTQKESN